MKSFIASVLLFVLVFTQSTTHADEKMCGSYHSTCLTQDVGSIKYALQLIGDESSDPISMDLSSTHYGDNKCRSSSNLYSIRLVSSIDNLDSVQKTYSIKVTNALFTMTDEGLAKYVCDAAVVAGEEYSVKQYHCVDEKGMDMFALYRHQIGKTRKADFSFDQSTVTVTLDEVITFNHISDEGCFAPTIAPTTIAPTIAPTTIAPTTAPTTIAPTTAPTTIPPTTAPTTIAPTTIAPTTAPTTIAPTTAPTTIPPTTAPTTIAPTTIAPTTIAPTTELPTTELPTTTTPTTTPTTVIPTASPTIPPTATPTEKPTEKPKSIVGWLVGGAIAILIGFAIIFYIVMKKNKRDEEEEMKPLV